MVMIARDHNQRNSCGVNPKKCIYNTTTIPKAQRSLKKTIKATATVYLLQDCVS